MNIAAGTLNLEKVRLRVTLICLIVLSLFFILALVVFLLTEQWTRRVFFFPEVNSKKYAAETRYLPRGGSEVDDIRRLLEDLLLGPSNFGNAALLPPGTRLASAMLESGELYVGFSKEIYQTESGLLIPREMLQGVADTLYFNFPRLKKIRFFIGGKELMDNPVFHQVDRKYDLARIMAPTIGDLSRTLRIVSRHPLFEPAACDRNALLFHDGAQWNEDILK
jgi:hypothetical protein